MLRRVFSAVAQLVAGQYFAILAAFLGRDLVESVLYFLTRSTAYRLITLPVFLAILGILVYAFLRGSSQTLGLKPPSAGTVALALLFALLLSGPAWVFSGNATAPLATGSPRLDALLQGVAARATTTVMPVPSLAGLAASSAFAFVLVSLMKRREPATPAHTMPDEGKQH